MAQSSLLGLSAILVALAVFVWRARPESAVNRLFATQTVLLASWVLGISGLQGGAHLDAWGRFTFASASLIPAAFLAFTSYYPTTAKWPSRRLIIFVFGCGGLFSALSLFTPLIVYENVLTAEGLERKTGVLYPAFAAYFLAAWIAALAVFTRKWLNARGIAKAQLQYLGAGIIISALGGIATNLLVPILTGRSTHSWLGPYFSVMFVALVAHAIIRHRLMDLRIVVHRGLALVLATALASAAVIAIVRVTSPGWWLAQDVGMGPHFLIITLVALVMLTTPIQQLLARLVDPYLRKGRIDPARALRDATQRLGHLMQPVELSEELQRILNEAFVPDFFAMAARPLDGGPLEALSPNSPGLADLFNVAAVMMDRRGPAVFLVSPAQEGEPKRLAMETLHTAGVEAVITLGRRDLLLGAVLLGPRRSGDAYFTIDLAFMESLAVLASISLENALLYRQQIQTLELSDRLLESLNSAVVAVDVGGRLTSVNSAAGALLGVGDSDRGSALEVLPPEIGWALALALSGQWVPREVEVAIDHESRGLLPVILSTAVLHGDRGTTAGALVVVTDLSTVKALERNQRRVEHFALMARFYAGIAHEIRSPLAAISNFIAMLPDRFDDQEYRETAARLLPIEVGRIVRLADRLRLMAPSEGGKLTPISLPPLLQDLVTMHAPAASESHVKLSLDSGDEVPNILGDQGQLVQLLVNLIRNGIEAMPRGGTLAISCYERGDGATIVVDVTDEGSGIEPALRAKIFEPFFTTKTSGTGLGLSICREIADFHRARLALLPRVGQPGTIARIEFPFGARDDTPASTTAGKSPTPASGRNNPIGDA